MDYGITVMIIGMATVFAFLILLIATINLSSYYFIKNADKYNDSNNKQKGNDSSVDVAIILAAIKSKRG